MFSGFADDAEVIDGYIELDETMPGIGFEGQSELFTIMSNLSNE